MRFIFENWIVKICGFVKKLTKKNCKYIYSKQVLNFFDLHLKNYMKGVSLSKKKKIL